MTGDDENLSMYAIEISRKLGRSLADKIQNEGVSKEDATIGAIYSAFDLACEFTGSRIGGIEWLRSAIDVVERQIIAEESDHYRSRKRH